MIFFSSLKFRTAIVKISFLFIVVAEIAVGKNSTNGITHSSSKIGILLVNHGSRSQSWRNGLMALEDSVRGSILKLPNIAGIKTAFMEYTEPSIATRLKEFDADGCTDVILIPIFLTVSPHTFDDIPTIIGQKEDPSAVQNLKLEKIERYTPKAKVHITPLLDFTDMLKKNVARRAKLLSTNPAEEGLVMIAYGDVTYEQEWKALLTDVGEYVQHADGISFYNYGWCGHIAHYDPQKTTEAIQTALNVKKKAVVVPVLVAQDETFQIKIIGGGIGKIPDNKTRVVYKPDSILPDADLQQWVIRIAGDYVQRIRSQQ